MSLPSTTPTSNSSWDPIQVREMVREAQFGGHHPSRLILGHQEASSFRQFVATNFNETVPARFRDTYFLGLKVEESELEHDFHVEGEQPDKFQSQVPLLIELPSRKADLEVPSERILNEHWDAAVLRGLINEKTADGRKPAFLFLGHHETRLLRRHLAAAFGPEAISNLRDLYYMGSFAPLVRKEFPTSKIAWAASPNGKTSPAAPSGSLVFSKETHPHSESLPPIANSAYRL